MTDTTLTPTDADIIALADETRTGEPGREGYILPISFARAVLAKWGGSEAQAAAPINTLKEAIAHAKEVAKGGSTCALEHAKLAAWLTELQLWRDSSFTLAVEAETRKQDEALIRQLVEALECNGEPDDPGHRCSHCDDYVDRNSVLRYAARKRLDGKP